MTWLQWGRGFSTAETRCGENFNAMILLASMGPRFFNRGNVRSWSGSRAMTPRLQWGRGFSTAETQLVDVASIHEYAASMGPRFFNRGNGPGPEVGSGRPCASMGPRFFNRGNTASSC